MSTYYKYVERSVDDQINWAEVGKNMSDMLKNEAAAREAKKAEINEASRQFGLDLSNAPTGDYDAGNTFCCRICKRNARVQTNARPYVKKRYIKFERLCT